MLKKQPIFKHVKTSRQSDQKMHAVVHAPTRAALVKIDWHESEARIILDFHHLRNQQK